MNRSIEKIARFIARNNPGLRVIMRTVRMKYNKIIFDIGRKEGNVDDKMVYLICYSGKAYSDSPKAIYKYMLTSQEYEEYSFVWSFKEPDRYAYLSRLPRTVVVKTKSKEERQAMRKAKYWITNYRLLDQYIPLNNQVYVQCWHGTPLKKLGFDLDNSDNAMNSSDEIRDKYAKDAARFSYLISPSDFTTRVFKSAWGLDDAKAARVILQEGYPRNDRLYNYNENEIKEIKEKLSLDPGKKIILYTPTWRDNQYDSSIGYTYSIGVDFEKLRKQLSDKYVILFRAHYIVANSFDLKQYNGFVIDVSRYDDINDLYIISDCLVTDYSSTFVDYTNLRRPICFFMYDLDEYRDSLRGFYIDLEGLPGPIVNSEDELCKVIKNMDNFEIDDKYREFIDKYNPLEDGCSTKRVVGKIIRG